MPIDLAELNEQWEAEGRGQAESSITKKLSDLNLPDNRIQERMKVLAGLAGEDSTIGGVAKRLADQQRALEAMTSRLPNLNVPSPPKLSLPHPQDFKFPPNPIHETNERLERIEDRFEQMQDIATEAAKIATGLQASTAEFLHDFRTVASGNDKTTRRAVWIGLLALLVAVATPVGQIIYSEVTSEPDIDPVLLTAVEDMQAELTSLREAQVEASDRLTEVLSADDQDTATILRDIRDLLSATAPAVSSPEEQ